MGILDAVRDALIERGAEVKVSGAREFDAEKHAIGSVFWEETDLEELAQAVNKIPCEDLDYSEWIGLLHAIKAACNGDFDFFIDVVIPWSLRYPQNTAEVVERKWDSINESSIGASYVFGIARQHGFRGGVHDFDGAPLSDEKQPAQKANPTDMPIPHAIDENFDPRKIPPRRWTLGLRFAPRTVTLGIAAASTGKTTLATRSALAIATGRELTDETVHITGKVWIICNEESLDELQRKIAGVLLREGIPVGEIANRVIISSGEEFILTIARKRDRGPVALTSAVQGMIDFIRANDIVHVVIDPLVSIHEGLDENDNAGLEKVMVGLCKVAQEGGCSIDLLHHANKASSGQAGNPMSSRGASSINAKARHSYTLTAASEDEKKLSGLSRSDRETLISMMGAKNNHARLTQMSRYFVLRSVNLFNAQADDDSAGDDPFAGDSVGVAVPFRMPEVAGETAAAARSEHAELFPAILEAMPTDRVPLNDILPDLCKAIGYQETKTRELVKIALPEGQPVGVCCNDAKWQLTLVRKGHPKFGPLELVRSVIPAHQVETESSR